MADTRRLPGALLENWQWQLKAACRGMDAAAFFHPPNERMRARERRAAAAKAICQECPVIAECLAHALEVREPYGIWGGATEDERAQLLGVQSLRYPAKVSDDSPSDSPGSVPEPERGQAPVATRRPVRARRPPAPTTHAQPHPTGR